MYDKLASLVSKAVTLNSYGDPIETNSSSREVFCRVISADTKEKTLAESRGETADLVFILPDAIDYNGEKYVDYDGLTYRVTDTKFGDTSDEIRLVVTRWQQA